RRRHTRCLSDWSSDVCSSDLTLALSTDDGIADGPENSPFNFRILAETVLVFSGGITFGIIYAHLQAASLGRYDLSCCFQVSLSRSEERRVGKECRSRLSRYLI